jgi:hypothetical protein
LTTLDLTIRASTYGKAPTPIAARIHEFTRAERVRRGLRAFLLCFGPGCAMLVVPPHVLWLLLWTTAGVVLGRKRYRQLREIVSLRGACPDCGKSEDLKPPEALPAIQRCAFCGAFLKLEDTEPAASLG